MVLSVGVEKIGRDLDTQISRTWSWYSSRYTGNSGDPRIPTGSATGAADAEAHGYLIQVLGHHDPNDRKEVPPSIVRAPQRGFWRWSAQ